MAKKHQPVSPPQFAVLFYRKDGKRVLSSGLATFSDIEATRKLAQRAMRLLKDAFYAEIHPYLDSQRYQTESVETVYRDTGEESRHEEVRPS